MNVLMELPSGQAVDADELRQAVAGMRDALGDAQGEIQGLRSRLEDTERREAELEAALADGTSGLHVSGGGLRRRVRLARRTIARLTVRSVPFAVLPLVWRNPLFDANWYRERYPDVRFSRMAPERHYRRHGVSEGRDPCPYFDTSWYLAHYPDVASGRMDPLDHYHLFGGWEGRDPGPASGLAGTSRSIRMSVRPSCNRCSISSGTGRSEGRLPRPPTRTRASAVAPTGVRGFGTRRWPRPKARGRYERVLAADPWTPRPAGHRRSVPAP